MRLIRCLALPALLLAGAACLRAEQAGGDKVTLKVAKFDELTRTLEALKGKVVVVDFWADT
jgi:hypothetical protein